MPNTLVHSRWKNGNLVFHDADDLGVGAEIFQISPATIYIGTSTNDVTMTMYGDVSLYGDLNLADEDISLAVGKYLYLDGSTGNDYLRTSTDNNVILNAQTTLSLGIGGTAEVKLAANVLSPQVSDGCALGSTSLMWSDLFLANGGVINWNNGKVTFTWDGDYLWIAGSGIVGAGQILWGANGSGITQTWYSDTAGSMWSYSTGAKRITLNGISIHIQDNDILQFGDIWDGDAYVSWSDNYLVWRCDTTQILWGTNAGSQGINQTWYTDTTGDYMAFAKGPKHLIFQDVHIQLNDSAELRFGSATGGDATFSFDGTYLNVGGTTLLAGTGGSQILWGIQGNGINQTWNSDTSGDYMWFSPSAKTFGLIEVYFILPVFASGLAQTGCLWLDTTDDKLHFYDGSAERVVTDDR